MFAVARTRAPPCEFIGGLASKDDLALGKTFDTKYLETENR